MDDFTNPRISINDSRETDENIQMFQKNQNQKKPQMRHFMSPTISATSKAIAPRNKILTERNEFSDSSETHQQKTPDLIPKNSRTFSRKTASGTRVNESEEDEYNHSLSKPYDPLTNYLSPRPKFLRYNPNRNREVYNRRETEVLEGSDGRSSSLSSSPKSSDEIENDEVDNVDTYDDHALEDEDEEFKVIENRHRAVYNRRETEVLEGSDGRSSSLSSSPKSSDEIENDEVDNVDTDDDHALEDEDEEFEVIENDGGSSWIGLLKVILVAVVLLLLTWYISCMNSPEPLPTIDLGNNGYISGYNATYDTFDTSNTGKQKKLNEYFYNINDQYFRTETDRHDLTWEFGITESAELPISFQDDQVPSASDSVSDFVSENEDEYKRLEAGLEGADIDKETEIAETVNKFESSDMVDTYLSENEGGNLVSLNSEMEIANIDGISAKGDGKVDENDMGIDDSAEIRDSAEIGDSRFSSTNDSNYGAFIGLFVIIASSIIGFYLKCKRTPIEKSRPVDKPLYNTISTEHISSENQNLPDFDETHVEKVESYVNTSMYFRSVEENAKDFPSNRAPTVELLGEFVVGKGSSIMKSCNSKSKTRETEMKPKEMESQGDTDSVFLDNVVNNTKGILSTPEFSASTTMDSPLYGSVTDKKKIVRKEEGSMTATPVRRSVRIRNRAMSP